MEVVDGRVVAIDVDVDVDVVGGDAGVVMDETEKWFFGDGEWRNEEEDGVLVLVMLVVVEVAIVAG